MKWKHLPQSTNVEDRRGQTVRRGAAVGGGTAILIAVVVLLMGGDTQDVAEALRQTQTAGSGPTSAASAPGGPLEDEAARFVSAVLADTEKTWSQILPQKGARYPPPTLVLFRDAVDSACGQASSAVGPFYCPPDQKVYIDLAFYDDLRDRFGASGDFAQAYVIAHEVGHHVQNVMGISDQVHQARSRMGQEDANALSVLQELQADCFAGIWANHAQTQRQLLEQGDVEEALGAAAAIGDDRIQKRTTGTVHPESWTHGSSQQRVSWFRRGLESGDVDACDTFAAARR